MNFAGLKTMISLIYFQFKSYLLSNNFGRRKNDPAKDRKALATYVELKGYGQGRPEKGANMACFSLDEIAKELNMSKRNLQRALRIERNLTDSMKELLDIYQKIFLSPKPKSILLDTSHSIMQFINAFQISFKTTIKIFCIIDNKHRTNVLKCY